MQGIKISAGIAIATLYKLDTVSMDVRQTVVDDPAHEIALYYEGIEKTKDQLIHLRDLSFEKFGHETSSIFESHLLMLEDPEVKRQVEALIRQTSCNASYAIRHVSDDFIRKFQSLDDTYLKERAIDLMDVTNRLLKNLLGLHLGDLSQIQYPVILVADELTPSDTASINTAFIKGIATESGGKTSHTSIIAKLLGIPLVIGIKGLMKEAVHGEKAILDGNVGEILLSFDDAVQKHYEDMMEADDLEKTALTTLIGRQTMTLDHHPVHLYGNITSDKDVPIVIDNDSEGIGLFRTEFLFLDRKSLPTEEEQYQSYKTVLEAMGEKPVVIRTLDIGGDKPLPELIVSHELNPFLGQRAIRFYQNHPSLFETQIRAMLKASQYGQLKIMFPMITTYEEWLWAKSIVKRMHQALNDQGIDVHPYQLGIMIEVPSAALHAERFAKDVDFFSIGTNDLIQYVFAADRTNDAVSYLYQPFHPVILTLIKHVVSAAKRHHKSVSVCGEMASDLVAGPLLIGLGVDELSMTPPVILKMRKLLQSLSHKKLQQMADDVLKLESEEAVIAWIDAHMPV